jgi:UDPglucose 6-dehydrogenase
MGRKHEAPQRLLEATHEIMKRRNVRCRRAFCIISTAIFAGRRFALWGLSFKPNTDDIREAPALTLIEELLEAGATVCAYDPEAAAAVKRVLGDRIDYAPRHYEACDNADALIIVTEWNKFREPDFDYMHELLKQPVIFDGRNVYELDTMREHNFTYYSIGRPTVHAPIAAL